MHRTEAFRRAFRGLLQIGVAEAVLTLFAAFHIFEPDEEQRRALLVVVTIAITFIQNWLEDQGAIPAIMKHEPAGDSA